MTTVNLFPLDIVFKTSNPIEPDRPPETFHFESCVRLANFLSEDLADNRGRFQREMDKQLKTNAQVLTWNKARTKFSDLPHFSKYRKKQYDRYHAAARAIAAGQVTEEQRNLVAGLRTEIEQSRITLQPGQKLFHGRSDEDLTRFKYYPSFVSTSLNFVVAENSAYRRSGVKAANGPAIVYALSLMMEVRAIWGHTFDCPEWELLLPPNLMFEETSRSQGRKFLFIEANVVN